MTLALRPDAEAICVKFIAEHPDVVALGVKVLGQTPKDPDSNPWIRVTQLDGPSSLHPEHLIGAYFQLDCYASQKGISGSQRREVESVGATVCAVLAVMKDATHEGGVVTGAEINGYARIPDVDFEPARERRIVTATCWMHS